MSEKKPCIYYGAAYSALITLRYSRSSSAADRSEFIEENKDACEKIIRSLETFDLVMLDLLKWEHDGSLSSGIVEEMIGFFEENQIQKRINLCYLLEDAYARQPLAEPMNHEVFRATARETCMRLEDYVKAS